MVTKVLSPIASVVQLAQMPVLIPLLDNSDILVFPIYNDYQTGILCCRVADILMQGK